MANQYTTLKNLEGYKTLDLKQHLLDQENTLYKFQQQFNDQTATDEKFFKAKEEHIRQQRDMIESWIKLLTKGNFHNMDVHLMVSEKD